MPNLRLCAIGASALAYKLVVLVIFWLAQAPCQAQLTTPTLKLGLPVEGELDKDFWIVNYVDHLPDTGAIRDFQCGRQTYDGHQGTDFALRSFRHMDSGVYAIASAPGRVMAVIDTLFDRNKMVDRSLGYGNYVAIRHSEGVFTYYAHLRRSSVLVRVGDSVQKGQRLGRIGSSGTSEDPHLHFEVWLNVDPFAGGCSNRLVRWDEQPTYSNTYELLDADVTTWPPSLDTLRERPPQAASIGKQDTAITFWSLQRHVTATDRLGVKWLTPDDETWFSYESTPGRASTYYYWWSWIRRPSTSGLWKVEYRVNDEVVAVRSFRVDPTVSVQPVDTESGASITRFGDVIRCSVTRPCSLNVYDVQGRLVASYSVPPGTSAHVISGQGALILELADGTSTIARVVDVR